MGITLSWSLTSSLFAKSGTTRTIIQYLMPFLNYRFLEENTLNYIRSRLEFAGFISAIDKEYQDEISYLKETLQRNKDYERTIWNEMGLIYTYLLDKEKDQFKAKTSYIEKAIECFDRSLILDKHKENRLPLVNKGFVYMEFKHDYHKAIECFEEAVDDYSTPADPYHLHPYSDGDLLNVIGVLYYELSNYDKAIECFEEAIEIDHQHELAIHNRSIAMSKMNKGRKFYTSNGKVIYH